MCNWGKTKTVRVLVPAWLSHSGNERQADKGIDQCLVPLVHELNARGILTAQILAVATGKAWA